MPKVYRKHMARTLVSAKQTSTGGPATVLTRAAICYKIWDGGLIMRFLFLWTLLAPLAFAAYPATLQVNLHQGKQLTFALKNHYRAPVSRFEVAVTFGSNLGCTLHVEVKQPSDLHPGASCGLETDASTGQVAEPNWKARIVYVDFADGMKWTPTSK